MEQVNTAFLCSGAITINEARIRHLDSLGLDFQKKQVLETGCGGAGDITQYLLVKGASVTLNDAREQNIQHLLNRNNLQLPYNTWNLNQPIPSETMFDIIVSYGTLYHLNKLDIAIQSFAEHCKEFTIISTCTNGQNDESLNVLWENPTPEMAVDAYGCRPGRLFYYNTLKKHFPYVYMLKTQPNHPDYPLSFPTPSTSGTFRNIFIGSHQPMKNKNFVEYLPNTYTL